MAGDNNRLYFKNYDRRPDDEEFAEVVKILKEEGAIISDKYIAPDCDWYQNCKVGEETFDIIFLDPPYAEVFLENAIKRITQIDILQSDGIIVAERPLGKDLPWEFEGYVRSKDYKYGNTLLTLYRKAE